MFRNPIELFRAYPANFFHHLGRVSRKMPLENLEYTACILQGVVGCMRLDPGSEYCRPFGVRFGNWLTSKLYKARSLVAPGGPFVLALFRCPAAEESVQILGVSVVLAKNCRRICI